MLNREILKKTLMRNANHHVEICVRIFIVNNANHLKKVIFVVYKNMKNVLLSIVDITIKITTRQRYEKNIFFTIR